MTAKDVVKQSFPIQVPRINYTYDDFGNLLGESGQEKTPPTYTYGPDQQMIHSFSESFHYNGSKYENGQKVDVSDCYTLSDKSFTYELGGKLLKVKSINHNDSNIYDRIDDNFIDYFYYSHDGAVAERHDDIGVTKYFTRLGGELLACDSGGQSYFYIQNIRGDVMMLVGTDGVVKSVRDYDASGQMLCKAPGHSDRDPFGFTGGLDAGNGLWKLGARFYDSGKNSFIQQDRYMGDPSDPLSLNRYVYCNLDPVNFVDPTGFMGEAVLNFGRQLTNSAPHPYLRAAGMAIAVLGTAIILVETIPAIIQEATKKHTPEQQDVVKRAKDAKKNGGLTPEEADQLLQDAQNAGLPSHGPESHPNRSAPTSKQTHIHVGPVDHIPVN
ncbi:MAG TPA: RHS repeat-associated core domain-containing protein [Bacillota bacterium]|nr:RHS repeat-associated core domain-containing protein [Bacillota bacterium]